MARAATAGRRAPEGARPVSTSGRVAVRLAAAPWMASALVAILLAGLAIASRVYTTNSLAGEPTSDEYFYGVYARSLARSLAAGQGFSLGDLSGEGRSIAVEAAVLSLALPWDVITVGRTFQALLNALCMPATFLLGRAIGLPRGTAAAAAILLLAVPELQELAWRFWTDSQATLLGLLYLAALVAFARRRSIGSLLGGLLTLGLLLLTKESTAAAFALLLPLALAAPYVARLRTWRGRLIGVGLPLAALAGALWALLTTPAFLRPLLDRGVLRRTLEAGPLVLGSVAEAFPRLPAYAEQVAGLVGVREVGAGFLWAWSLGLGWLALELGNALLARRRGPQSWPAWLLALLAWLPTLAILAPGLRSLEQPLALALLALAALGALAGARATRHGDDAPLAWGLAMLGLLVAVLGFERLVISANPKLGGGAALTFRSFMPAVPLFALLAAGGLWSAWRGIARVVPGSRAWLPSLGALAAALLLAGAWSPLVSERLSGQPLLGRVADRGADVTKAEGLRVEVMARAEGWLRENVRPTDPTITGVPRQLAWYADLGVDGLQRLVDLGSQPRTQEERRAYLRDRVGPLGASYVVDFNVAWTEPDSDRARQWRQTFEWLATRPHLEVAYLERDRFGHPVFYVVRNHGYAASYGYRDREEARAEQLARNGS